MEEDSQASSGGVPVKLLNAERKERNKEDEEEETALDGEFIKVEKESIDSSHTHKTTTTVEERPASEMTLNNSIPNIDLVDAQEKIKELKLELQNVAQELQRSESEKARFQAEVDVANEKLEKNDKYCEELELDLKRMKEEIIQSDLKHGSQIESLQESLRAQELKHKELIDVKETFEGLSVELDCSRKKMEQLELDLLSSAGKAQKFEELSEERGSHAELESKRALEFEKMLEVVKLSAKDMEDQMGSMQEELKGLYAKIKENQHIEEALNSATLELSVAREELELSTSRVAELEQKIVSDRDIIQELTEELGLRKASEEQLREDLVATENLFSSSKEDLQAKIANLEEIELKFQEELKTRELTETSLKNQEIQTLSLREQLVKVTGDKEALEASLSDLNNDLLQSKEMCNHLEVKLNLADQNFSKTDSLLSQALANNSELEQKLKSLDDLHRESGIVAETASQKNLELEDLIRASNASEKASKAQLREIEMRLIATEKRNMDLEQQLNFKELKFRDADRELKELQQKTSELTSLLRDVEEESALSKCHFQAYEDRISQLESSLSKSSSRNKELEQELKDLTEKCAGHENWASTTHQRSLELEDLIQTSNFKAEDARNRVGELELLLETANYRIQELEEQLSITEVKNRDVETELKRCSDQVSELTAELETFQVKSSSLESALQSANEKERELADLLNVSMEEREKNEDLSNRSGEKLLEAENFLEVLQIELKSTKEKLEGLEKDLEASGIRETGILEKLKCAEEQLEHQGKAVEQATARSLELESLHESLAKDSDQKLQEAAVSLTQKDSEAKQLFEKQKAIEEQAAFYQEKATEATEKAASLQDELVASSIKLLSLESSIDELKRKVLEMEMESEQSSLENEMLAKTNTKLKEELEAHQSKVTELHQTLNSIHAEKEATADLVASHVKTITELTDRHSRGLELQSVTEIQKVELGEALLKIRSLEGTVEEMQGKARQFESENEGLAEANLKLTQELAAYETEMNNLQTVLNTVVVEKEETFGQLHSSKKTIEDLIQQLASEGERLQSQISSVMEENNMLNGMYQDAKKKLQAVIVQMEEQLKEQMEKENSLNAEHESLKAELTMKSEMQARIVELEQKLLFTEMQFKEKIENIWSEAAQKEAVLTSKLEENASIVQERNVLDEQLAQLQKELHLAHITIEEQKETDSRKELEREAAMKQSLGEIEVKHQRVVLLEKQVDELGQKLQIAEAQYKEKDIEGGKKLALVSEELDGLRSKLSQIAELEKKIIELENKLQLANTKSGEQYKGEVIEADAKDGVEVKSRDLSPGTTTPSKRKSKKRSEGSRQSEEFTSTIPVTTTSEPSVAMTFKFILGVALVSVIIGIILGKRY